MEANLTIRQGQRIITNMTHRTGTIVKVIPTQRPNEPVLVCFDDCQMGWIRPQVMHNYSDN